MFTKNRRAGLLGSGKLSIGIAHHNDFDGAYFTIQDIRKELVFNGRRDLLSKIEFVIIENDKTSKHAEELKDFCAINLSLDKSLNYNIVSVNGTASVKDEIIRNATGDFVLVLDCHVLLCPTLNVIERLFDFMEKNPDSDDLYNGPLVHDNMRGLSTHYKNIWRDSNWGVWSTAFKCKCSNCYFDIDSDLEREDIEVNCITSGKKISSCSNCGAVLPVTKNDLNKKLSSKEILPVGLNSEEAMFEIFAQGTGCFFVRRESWLGYNKNAFGFGGEEGYIHEKYRKNGRKTYCLPFLKWLHRFNRVEDVKYPLKLEYKLRNYILEFTELNLDLCPLHKHFVEDNGFDEIVYNSFVREANYLYNRK